MLDNEHLRNLVNRLQAELGRAQTALGKDAQSLHKLDSEADEVTPTPSWVFESETMTPLLVAYDHRIKVSCRRPLARMKASHSDLPSSDGHHAC